MTAERVFARELSDSTFAFKTSDEEYAPNYTLFPTGERVNRVFICGTITEVEDVSDPNEDEYLKGRIVDPTGTFAVYGGQYAPEAANFLRAAETPSYVAVTAKINTFETDEGEINVSLRPETMTEVDERTRHSWVADTMEQTLNRIEAFDPDSNLVAQLASDQYGGYLSEYIDECVVEAAHDLQNHDYGSDDSE
jgi:RPA family protein